MLHKIYVDGSESGEIRWFDKTINIRGRTQTEAKPIHEIEYIAIFYALNENLTRFALGDTIEIYCDREPVIKQLNNKSGIKDKHIRNLADKVWDLVQENGLTVRFKWISRDNNPAGKMLGR